MGPEIYSALGAFFAWPGPLFLVVGTFLGAVFGILPGLGGAQAIALLTPLTFGLDPSYAMMLIIGAMGAVPFGGSISSILINTPGTGVNAATTLDGFPLTRQGKAGLALGASATASGLGAIVGAIILVLLIPVGRYIVLAFSYPEYFMLAFMGISIIAVVSKGALWKGLVAGVLGLMISTIGFDPVTSAIRFTFGIQYLWDGIKIVPAVIGIFAIPECVELFAQKGRIALSEVKASGRDIWDGVKSIFQNFGLFMRSSIIGTVIGIIPGVGGGVACWLAYAHAVQTSKKGRFGEGDIRGVIAPEASNNAKDGGSLVPTLIFGIPGSVEMAVLLGTLMLHGLDPGPRLLLDNANVVYVLVITLVLSNILVSVLGLLGAKYLVRLTTIRTSLLAPVVFSVALLGAYATDGIFADVIVALVFGVLGYCMKVYGFSRVAMVIALILGELAQKNFHQTLMSQGPAAFFTRPISLVLFVVTAVMVIYPFLAARRSKGGKDLAQDL